MSNRHSHSPSYHVRSPTPSEEWAADADRQSPGLPHDDPEPPCIRPRDTLIEEWAADIADAQEEETTLSPVPNTWGDPADRPYACPWCPRTFTRQNYWKAHLETHDEVGGQKTYPVPTVCAPSVGGTIVTSMPAHTTMMTPTVSNVGCARKGSPASMICSGTTRHITLEPQTLLLASPPVMPNPRTFPVATSSTRGPSRAPHEGSSDEAEASFKPRREVVKPSALGKYAFCQHFSPGGGLMSALDVPCGTPHYHTWDFPAPTRTTCCTPPSHTSCGPPTPACIPPFPSRLSNRTDYASLAALVTLANGIIVRSTGSNKFKVRKRDKVVQHGATRAMELFAEEDDTGNKDALAAAQKIDETLYDALPNTEDPAEEVKEILSGYESLISEINIGADRLKWVDYGIIDVQNAINNDQIISNFLAFTTTSTPIIKHLSLQPPCRTVPPSSTRGYRCIQRAAEEFDKIPLPVRLQGDEMQRQLWRLEDLHDGGGLGFTVELFFLSLSQLVSTSSSRESHSALYTGTFRAITSDWSKHKYSLGTQNLLLDIAMSRRWEFDGQYPAYIVDEFLFLLGNIFEGQTGPHIDEARQLFERVRFYGSRKFSERDKGSSTFKTSMWHWNIVRPLRASPNAASVRSLVIASEGLTPAEAAAPERTLPRRHRRAGWAVWRYEEQGSMYHVVGVAAFSCFPQAHGGSSSSRDASPD
ncbi:hypothetical protein BGY98DRAFT_1179094 [Russula aff. rugulosa BPL654]|nr:hypothetical protein BGY98DRAFT_1179094 [Russula aff. rugulosa BPL654]